MRYCSYEGQSFPDEEFVREGGNILHRRTPRHTTRGEVVDPKRRVPNLPGAMRMPRPSLRDRIRRTVGRDKGAAK